MPDPRSWAWPSTVEGWVTLIAGLIVIGGVLLSPIRAFRQRVAAAARAVQNAWRRIVEYSPRVGAPERSLAYELQAWWAQRTGRPVPRRRTFSRIESYAPTVTVTKKPLTLKARCEVLVEQMDAALGEHDHKHPRDRLVGEFRWVRKALDPLYAELQSAGWHDDDLDLARSGDNDRRDVQRARDALTRIDWERVEDYQRRNRRS